MAEKTGVYARREESKQKFSNFFKQKPRFNYSNSPADRIVEQVMRMLDPVLQSKCERCDEDEKEVLQAKKSPEEVLVNQGLVEPPIVHEVLRLLGQPLDTVASAFMEPRFGHDFSRVRVHTDTKAAESARAVNARAFTLGKDMVFGSEQYLPMESAGCTPQAHGLVYTIQQRSGENFRLVNNDSLKHEQKTNTAFDHTLYKPSIPVLKSLNSRSIMRQELDPEEYPKIERNFGLKPYKLMDSPAPKKDEKCEEFPGGSTDCEVNETTGIPTGKVTRSIEETNPCTRPCVEQHEDVHVKQMKKLCPELRDCYLAADKGKRPASDCVKMAIFGSKERECEAYKVSVPCMENRMRKAKECQSEENKKYGTRKLASEKCFRDKNCK